MYISIVVVDVDSKAQSFIKKIINGLALGSGELQHRAFFMEILKELIKGKWNNEEYKLEYSKNKN